MFLQPYKMEPRNIHLVAKIRPFATHLLRRTARVQTPLQLHRQTGHKRYVGGGRRSGEDHSHCGQTCMAVETGLEQQGREGL